MDKLNEQFSAAIKQSMRGILASGQSSTEKIASIHGYFSDELMGLMSELGIDVRCKSKGIDDSKEKREAGRYVDAYFIEPGEKYGVVGEYKAFLSSFGKNINNDLDGLLGRSVIIKNAGHSFFCMYVVPEYIPLCNKDGDIIGFDSVSSFIAKHGDLVRSFAKRPAETLAPDFCSINIYNVADFSPEGWVGKNKADLISHIASSELGWCDAFNHMSMPGKIIINSIRETALALGNLVKARRAIFSI